MSLDTLSHLSRIIDQVSKDKGFNKQVIVNSVVQGVLTAIRKKYGTYRDIEVKYNEDNGEIELFEFKKVVPDDEFEDELIEIKYSEAVHLDSETQLEDQIGTKLEMKDLGRIDAQMAKQIIIQNLRSAENEVIFNEFEKRKGEIASGIVRRVDPAMIVVDLEKTEAYIPRKEQIPGERYKSGDRIQGYLLEVRQTTRGPQIIMSRAHENYLIKLFETEVPEVYEGIIKIVGAAREPGQRAKMSVYSMDAAVHPVGACVGVKGSRVQNITQELKGERIDIIMWEENPVQYVCNALAPAKIVKVIVDEENRKMQTIVPDDQLSLAIGKKGQNVRLAVRLSGWNLDLVSESEIENRKKAALFNLCLLPNMTETMAQGIYQQGLSSVQGLATASLDDVKSIPGYEDEKKAKELILSAQKLVRQYRAEGKEFPKWEDSSQKAATSTPVVSKENAEEILKRELAQLEQKDEKEKEASQEKTEETQETKTAEIKTESAEETQEAKPAETESATTESTDETETEETQETKTAEIETESAEETESATTENSDETETEETQETKTAEIETETEKTQETKTAEIETETEKTQETKTAEIETEETESTTTENSDETKPQDTSEDK